MDQPTILIWDISFIDISPTFTVSGEEVPPLSQGQNLGCVLNATLEIKRINKLNVKSHYVTPIPLRLSRESSGAVSISVPTPKGLSLFCSFTVLLLIFLLPELGLKLEVDLQVEPGDVKTVCFSRVLGQWQNLYKNI